MLFRNDKKDNRNASSNETVPLLPLDLESAHVRLVAPGAYITLPTAITMHRLRDVRWLNPPRPGRKPPGWSVVVGATRRVVAVREPVELAA